MKSQLLYGCTYGILYYHGNVKVVITRKPWLYVKLDKSNRAYGWWKG